MAVSVEAASSATPTESERSPVDLTLGVHALPEPNKAAPLTLFQRVMRSHLGLAIFVVIAAGMGFFPLIGTTLFTFVLLWIGAPHWPLRRYVDHCVGAWMSIMTTVYECVLKIRTFGHSRRFQKRSLILMNHCSYFDWMYFWSVSDRQGDLSYWKVLTSRLPLKILPVIGQCVQLACYVFLDRRWERDRAEFRRKLYYYNAIDYPLQMLMFPEGGDFTPQSKAKSDKFADDNGLPRLQHCFYPRSTGFVYTINAMRDAGLDAIYDMTIAYPDMLPKEPVDLLYLILPREVHYHITKYSNSEVPQGKKELEEWLRQRWIEKEERLKTFYRHREFREKDGTKSVEVKRPRNVQYLVLSLLFVVFLNLSVLVPLWYFPYAGGVYMMATVVFLVTRHRRGLGHAFMDPKNREIEQAAQRSKLNVDI